jgi:hypothetical protein
VLTASLDASKRGAFVRRVRAYQLYLPEVWASDAQRRAIFKQRSRIASMVHIVIGCKREERAAVGRRARGSRAARGFLSPLDGRPLNARRDYYLDLSWCANQG